MYYNLKYQKKVHRMAFLSPYVLPIAQVVCVLEFIQLLKLFEIKNFSISSNFGAP